MTLSAFWGMGQIVSLLIIVLIYTTKEKEMYEIAAKKTLPPLEPKDMVVMSMALMAVTAFLTSWAFVVFMILNSIILHIRKAMGYKNKNDDDERT